MNTLDDHELDENKPNEDEMPGKLGVYERPERQGLSSTALIIIVILALIVAFMLWRFVF